MKWDSRRPSARYYTNPLRCFYLSRSFVSETHNGQLGQKEGTPCSGHVVANGDRHDCQRSRVVATRRYTLRGVHAASPPSRNKYMPLLEAPTSLRLVLR